MEWQHLATFVPLAVIAACAEPAAPVDTDLARPAGMAEHILAVRTWSGGKPMPTPRTNLATAALGGLVYAIGGEGGTYKLESLNPSTGNWTSRAALIAGRTMISGAVAINGLIYVVGGRDNQGWATKSLQMYNPSSNTWSQKRDLPVASARGASAVINGKLYVYTPKNPTTDGWPMLHRYDPSTNAWVKLARPPRGVDYPAAGAIGQKFYLAGGHTSEPIDSLFVYDPVQNSWSAKQGMPTKRAEAAGAVMSTNLLSSRLYVIGGRNKAGNVLSTVEAYNPGTDSWTTVARLRVPRRGLAAATAGGVIYALGGRDSGDPLAAPLGTNEAY